jgi:L-Ala-D/L-Glu epimerase
MQRYKINTVRQLKLTFYPYTLHLKRPFTLASGSRSTTPIVIMELLYMGEIGYGEASLPPYLGETQETVGSFLKLIDVSKLDPFNIEQSLEYIDSLAPANNAAKASVDFALFDLLGKIKNESCFDILKIKECFPVPSSYTIAIDFPKNILERIEDAKEFKILKVKLGGKDDHLTIKTILEASDKPFCVDINQGWTNKYLALDFIKMLQDNNCLYIEQPFAKEMVRETLWVSDRSDIPVIADEAVKVFADIAPLDGIYHGINIKLMKSCGLLQAKKMVEFAREKKLKTVIGSMTETSLGITAAANFSCLTDWVDLDSSHLIVDDPFSGVKIKEGLISPENKLPGIGVVKKLPLPGNR